MTSSILTKLENCFRIVLHCKTLQFGQIPEERTIHNPQSKMVEKVGEMVYTYQKVSDKIALK